MGMTRKLISTRIGRVKFQWVSVILCLLSATFVFNLIAQKYVHSEIWNMLEYNHHINDSVKKLFIIHSSNTLLKKSSAEIRITKDNLKDIQIPKTPTKILNTAQEPLVSENIDNHKESNTSSLLSRGTNTSLLNRGTNTSLLNRGTNTSLLNRGTNTSLEEYKATRNLTNIQDLPHSGKIRSLWSKDPECKRFTVGFSSGLPLVWLASYPRSGNSWTRYLIEAATGVYTNSIYRDGTMVKLGYYGEGEKVGTGRCVVTKTHRCWEQGQDQHDPTILLIRNPAKSIMSFWDFKKAPMRNKYFFQASNETYASTEFRKFVESNIKVWRQVTENRLLWSRQLLVVLFEELVQNPILQVQRILKFLGLQEDPARMACLIKYIDGKAKGVKKEIDPYTEEEKVQMREATEAIIWAGKLRGITLPVYL